MSEQEIKSQVRKFYDQVGWSIVGDGVYQNARFEDLRPVAREYVHRCHLRVGRHLASKGKFLLDAGSGPIQYPEYLTYSQGYHRRICLDISITALQEARKRIGAHGLYVVADVANLPFKSQAFDGVLSLHTLHHLPAGDQTQAYLELYRVLEENRKAVVVNGWTDSKLMNNFGGLRRFMASLGKKWRDLRHGVEIELESDTRPLKPARPAATGTFIQKQDPAWLHQALDGKMNFEIRVWRSVSVQFMRDVFQAKLGGKLWLKLLFWLEERFPHYFGENGQYPMVVIRKGSQ